MINNKVKTALGSILAGIQTLPVKIKTSGKKTRIVLGVILTLVVAATVFFALKWFTSSQQVFASTAAVRVELPPGIKSKNLQNLNKEQEKKLSEKIKNALSKKPNEIALQGFVIPQVIILTENNQPIFIENQTPPNPTSAPTLTPTPTPSVTPSLSPSPSPSVTPSLSPSPTPTPTPSGPLIIQAEDLADWQSPLISGWEKSCGTGFCMINSYPKDKKSTFNFTYTCPTSHSLKAVVEKGRNRGSFLIRSTNPATAATINLQQNNEFAFPEVELLTGLASGFQQITVTANGDGYTSIDKFLLPDDCVKTETYLGINEINFTFSQEAKDAYYGESGSSLENDVNKIYQKAKEIFGPPYKNINVSIELSNDGRYYNATLDKIVFEKNDPPSKLQLIWMVLSAFHDDLVNFMPENWERGMIETTLYEINRALFEPDQNYAGSQTSTYELINNPAVSGNNGALSQGEVTGVLSTHNLVITAWRKPYYEDRNFFVNLNKAIYQQQTIDNTLKDKLLSIAAGIKGDIEGMPAVEWFNNQHILRFNAQEGKWIVLIVQKAANETDDVLVHIQALEVFGNGNKTGKNNLDVLVKAFDPDNNQVLSSTAKTARVNSYNGVVALGVLPAAANDGCLRFNYDIAGFGTTEFYYPYKNSLAMAPGGTGANGIYGCVDQKDGKVLAKAGAFEQSVDLTGGAFSFPGLKDYQGQIELTFTPSTGNQTRKKTVTKLAGDYYTFIKTNAPPVSRAGSREATPSGETAKGECGTENWTDYSNEKFGYKMKFPRNWGQDPAYSGQNSTFTRESLSSSQKPEDLTDPQKKVSHIEVLVSAKDLKTDEDYGRWFEDGSGNQEQSSVTFKGVQAEKYVNDTPMPAGDYHSEMYYFKKGDFYYLLSTGIYVTSDVKEKNEQILNCFLENFELTGEGKLSDKLLQCPQGMYGIESESQCQNPPFNQPVCGHIRSVYDMGQMRDGTQEFSNLCAYCGFFDYKGYYGLRGTKMYALGYTEGRCQ
ncbi:hypothetical protein KKE78_01205 [Patescibacteria group bacterium]|nr:hypothetical protein [Patescibacteria group bacterium]